MIYRHRVRLALAAALVVTGVALPARAQEKGQIGMTMGYPESVGVVWHLTDSVAVRPEFSFRASSAGLENNSSHAFGVGISGILYVTRSEGLRTYVVPRFSYIRATTTFESISYDTSLLQNLTSSLPLTTLPPPSVFIGRPTRIEYASDSYTVAGSFGAQYSMHRRFSVFGEAGVGYATNRSGIADLSSVLSRIVPPNDVGNPHSWSTRTAAGVIVYFKD
jgi:hypothetical protein